MKTAFSASGGRYRRAMSSQLKIGRNDPCPCGSGRKFKHCCLQKHSVPRETLWAGQREASDALTSEMMRYVDDHFSQLIPEAWRDFHLGYDDGVSLDSDERMIFMPYLLFHWNPTRLSRTRKTPPEGGVVAQSFLRERGHRLLELQLQILNEAIARPCSFYQVLACKPGECFALADVLTGAQAEVVERKASQCVRMGDIIYGSVWILPGIAVLGCCASIAIPPERKLAILALRKRLRRRIVRQNRELAEQDLVRYADSVRETYLDLRDSLGKPPLLHNTDGDPLEFHTLTFQIGSAEAAFSALAPLAWGHSPKDLLHDAEFDKDGKVRRVEIPWTKKGNKMIASWDNTILGHIRIDDHLLVAEVNSRQRAARFRTEIEKRLGAAAVHQSTVARTMEEMRAKAKNRSASQNRSSADISEAFRLDPKARTQAQELMQKQVEAWVCQKIPALGGRTPLQAVHDPEGKEMVEALLLGWERRIKDFPSGLIPDLNAVRRLLNLGAPDSPPEQ